jgi:hypothetical protein
MLAANYIVWPAAHALQFALVPAEHRLLAVTLVGVSPQQAQWLLAS